MRIHVYHRHYRNGDVHLRRDENHDRSIGIVSTSDLLEATLDRLRGRIGIAVVEEILLERARRDRTSMNTFRKAEQKIRWNHFSVYRWVSVFRSACIYCVSSSWCWRFRHPVQWSARLVSANTHSIIPVRLVSWKAQKFGTHLPTRERRNSLDLPFLPILRLGESWGVTKLVPSQ